MTTPQLAKLARGGAPGAASEFVSTLAIIRRATLSRLGFSALAALVAHVGAGWDGALYWFIAVGIWELALRPALEARISEPQDERSVKRAFGLLAAINLFGAAGYCVLPVASWASGTPIGQVLAAAWLCGSGSHLFVYFSNNVALLVANLIPPAAAALLMPIFAGDAGWTERVLGSVVLLTILAATGVFASDRNALLKSLADEARAREWAEDANEAKRQFLAIISHELRTPLNGVVGYSEMLCEELEARGEAQLTDDASKILSSGRQLLGLVNRIITLARIESGAVEMEIMDVSVTDLVHQAVTDIRSLAEANGNRLTLHADKMGVVALDADKLSQCIAELCANAAKFTSNGTIEVIAKRTDARSMEMLQIDVADTGIGIDEKLIAQIFQPFVQGEGRADRRFEGAGAGLAVVRALARLMGGDVNCRNRDGGGAIFTLRVPITAPAPHLHGDLGQAA